MLNEMGNSMQQLWKQIKPKIEIIKLIQWNIRITINKIKFYVIVMNKNIDESKSNYGNTSIKIMTKIV